MELKHTLYGCMEDIYYLLIVPYGIETIECANGLVDAEPFNRTLWN